MNGLAGQLLPANSLRDQPCAVLKGGRFPNDPKWTRASLKSLGVRIVYAPANGGLAAHVYVDDLPDDTKAALTKEQLRVDLGESTSHRLDQFVYLPPKRRNEALHAFRRIEEFHAELATSGKREAAETVAARHGVHRSTILRDLKRIEGVPSEEWLPALARKYIGGRARTDIDPDAWRYFLSAKAASSDQPWAAIYRKLKKAAAVRGWTIPSLKTLLRRVEAELSAGTLALITSGPKALEAFYPAQTRTVEHLAALDIVNLDGRRADVFVRWEDGEIGRPIAIALQDVMSRKLLGWIITKTENADDTKAMLLTVMRQYGRFRKLRTDNSRAFASKKIAGGAAYQFRWKPIEDELTGILPLMGIEVGFALPANGRSKPIERAFRDLASDIDRAPEFKRAYCGNRPDAKPEDFDGSAVDIAAFREVFEREVAEHNAREGRRTEMARGVKSFDQVFEESYALQPRRPLTAAQERYFHSEIVYLAPNEQGAMKHKGFTWWSVEHQETLARWRGTKLRVSFNPDSMSEAVAVEAPDGQLLVDALPCLGKGRFDSTEAARQHARGRQQFLKAERAKAKALKLMTQAELLAYEKDIRAASAGSPPPASMNNVIEPLLGRKRAKPAADPALPASGMSREDIQKALIEGTKKFAAAMRQTG